MVLIAVTTQGNLVPRASVVRGRRRGNKPRLLLMDDATGLVQLPELQSRLLEDRLHLFWCPKLCRKLMSCVFSNLRGCFLQYVYQVLKSLYLCNPFYCGLVIGCLMEPREKSFYKRMDQVNVTL